MGVDQGPDGAVVLASTPITSSGSLVSAKGVKFRRSEKTTTISRRWLSRRLSSPTTRSASCGERKWRRRLVRSSSATCWATRVSSSVFQSPQLVGLARMVSW